MTGPDKKTIAIQLGFWSCHNSPFVVQRSKC